MRFRKLRIVWAAISGIALVLLCVLWIRSYNTTRSRDVVSRQISSNYSLAVASESGSIFIGAYLTQDYFTGPWQLFHAADGSWGGRRNVLKWFHQAVTPNSAKVLVPYWFPVLLCGLSGIASSFPWLRYRFSLRTLLMATTLIAVALGLVEWATN